MSHWSIETVPCNGVREARTLLPTTRPSLIFCEEDLPDGTYRELLQDISKAARTRVVVISADAELDTHYNEALALGAFDMIASPCRRSDVQWIAIRAMQDELRRSGGRRRGKLGPKALTRLRRRRLKKARFPMDTEIAGASRQTQHGRVVNAL